MKPTDEQHKTRYFCENPETHKFEEVFPESEIGDHELVIPMFWGGINARDGKGQYCTVPGTEFYGPIPQEW